MSCNDKQKKDENNSEQKSLNQVYLEQKLFSSPIHEYVKVISLLFVAHYVCLLSSNSKYNQIQELIAKNEPLQYLIIFLFCYLQSNLKLDVSIISTIIIFGIYIGISYYVKKNI
jgi:hypothetical protein